MGTGATAGASAQGGGKPRLHRRQPDPGLRRRRPRPRHRLLRRAPTTPSPPAPRSATTCRPWSTPPGTRPPAGIRTPATPSDRRPCRPPPAWETPNTQTSPGVFFYGGHWVMFYDASVKPPPRRQRVQLPVGGDGHRRSPAASPVFTDSSGGPAVLRCGPAAACSTRARSSTRPPVRPTCCGSPTTAARRQPSQVWSVRSAPTGPASPAHRPSCSPWTRPTCPGRPPSTTPRWWPTSGGYEPALLGRRLPVGQLLAGPHHLQRPPRAVQPAGERTVPHLLRIGGRPGWRVAVPGRRRSVVAGLRRLASRVHQLLVRRSADGSSPHPST